MLWYTLIIFPHSIHYCKNDENLYENTNSSNDNYKIIHITKNNKDIIIIPCFMLFITWYFIVLNNYTCTLYITIMVLSECVIPLCFCILNLYSRANELKKHKTCNRLPGRRALVVVFIKNMLFEIIAFVVFECL